MLSRVSIAHDWPMTGTSLMHVRVVVAVGLYTVSALVSVPNQRVIRWMIIFRNWTSLLRLPAGKASLTEREVEETQASDSPMTERQLSRNPGRPRARRSCIQRDRFPSWNTFLSIITPIFVHMRPILILYYPNMRFRLSIKCVVPLSCVLPFGFSAPSYQHYTTTLVIIHNSHCC